MVGIATARRAAAGIRGSILCDTAFCSMIVGDTAGTTRQRHASGADDLSSGRPTEGDENDDSEREILLARYLKRRASDVTEFVASADTYAIIDKLRPYFNVNTKDVFRKVLYSVLPSISSSRRETDAPQPRYAQEPDLYGPLMLSLTMAAIMATSVESSSDSSVAKNRHWVEQMILTTSIFLGLACWVGFSIFLKIGFGCTLKNGSLSWLTLASASGYGLFAHCIALGCHASMFSFLFYPVWILFAIPSSISLYQQLAFHVSKRRRNITRDIQTVDVFLVLAALAHFFISYVLRNKVLEISSILLTVVNGEDSNTRPVNLGNGLVMEQNADGDIHIHPPPMP